MDAKAPPLLTALADYVKAGPQSLLHLAQIVGYAQDYVWFCGLVSKLLPDEADTVLSAPGAAEQVHRFESLVSERYFPLCDWAIEWYLEEPDEEPVWRMLGRGIPFEVFGIDPDGLHELWSNFRPGLCALMLLPAPPSLYWDHDDGGMRVAWLEAGAAHIPDVVLKRIPEGGIPCEDLRDSVHGTRFEGASLAASWLHSDSGNFFFDVSLYDEGFGSYYDPWTDDVIEAATKAWQVAKPMLDSMHDLAGWLEHDLPARFAEMLDFILAQIAELAADIDESPGHIKPEVRDDS